MLKGRGSGAGLGSVERLMVFGSAGAALGLPLRHQQKAQVSDALNVVLMVSKVHGLKFSQRWKSTVKYLEGSTKR